VAFGDPSAPSSSVTFSTTGTYVLTLTANDGDFSVSDTVTIVVNGVAGTPNTAIQLGGTNAYVTLGPAPQLGASNFTIEAWIRRDGAGVATFSGTGGITAVPLVTKGMAETERQQRRHELLPRHQPDDGEAGGRLRRQRDRPEITLSTGTR
jgi:hypothetical protein